jgi:hypothetical protein
MGAIVVGAQLPIPRPVAKIHTMRMRLGHPYGKNIFISQSKWRNVDIGAASEIAADHQS